MGEVKSRMKSEGLLSLFDWKNKSRKKLLSDGSSLPKSTHGEKLGDDWTTAGQVLCEEEEEEEEGGTVGVISSKGNGDVRCFSLLTDEENASRVPGVVARLMGLDSMPSASELNFTLSQDLQLFPGKGIKNGSSNFHCNGQFTHMVDRVNVDSRRAVNSKTLNSPIEGFHMEMLPLKWTKSSPVSYHKLSSSTKNPIIIPQKNVIHVREEAAKGYLHPSWTNGIMKGRSVGSSSTTLRYKYAPARVVNSSSRPTESAAARSSTGHHLNRSLNYSDGGIACQSSLLINGTRKYHAKGNCKESNSLSKFNKVNDKVNVQVRGNNNRMALFRKDHDGCEVNESLNGQKSRNLKTFSDNASVVFRKNVLQPKKKSFGSLLISDRQSSKFQGKNLYSKKKAGNKLSASKNFGNSKCSSVITEKEEEEKKGEDFALAYKSSPLKKGFIGKKSLNSEKEAVSSSEIDNYRKCILHNFVIDEHSRWTKNNMKNGTDVASFTFATSIVKPVLGHHIPSWVERGEKENERSLCVDIEKKASCFVTTNQSCNVLDNIDGDALGILLEQKLNELATRINSPYSNSLKASDFESSFDPQDSVSEPSYSFNEPDEHGSLNCKSYDNHMFQLGHSSADALVPSMRTKVQQEIDVVETSSCSSSGSHLDVQKEPHHQSPLSILEASFSPYESYDSPEGSVHTKANKTTSYFRFQVQEVAEVQLEISDSVCSALGESMCSITDHKKEEMEYVREILCSIGLIPNCIDLCHIAHSGNILNPNLFQELECRRSRSVVHDGGDSLVCRLRRKLLFDCVNECLDLKFSIHFQAGYRAWSKAVAFVGKGLAEQVFMEISVLRSIENLMVDELMDRDMNDQRGRWVDFEAEAFETGEEIGRGVLSSLVEQLVADLLTETDCACILTTFSWDEILLRQSSKMGGYLSTSKLEIA